MSSTELSLGDTMFIIIAYWFSSFTFFSKYNGEYDFEDRMYCDSLVDCFRAHVDYGFVAMPFW